MASIGDVFLRLLADDKEFAADVVKKAGAAGDTAGKSMGQRMGTAAKAGITAFGASAGYLLAGAVEAGSEFEDQLRTINTVAGLTDDELAKVGDNIQALSRETGKSTDDLTAGFYDLVSAGVPAGEAINVLRDSAKFATGALGTTGEAVDLVTSAMNAYGLEAKDSSRITDIFAKAVADGKVTAAQLGASIAQIAPIAASAGVSLEEVSSGFAILTAKGVPAAQAATQMRAAISGLLTPNETLNRIQERTGQNFTELLKAKGLAATLEELRKATHGNSDEFAKALGSIDAYQFALASTGENAEVFAAQIAETGDVTGLATQQYDEASKSSKKFGARLAAVFNTFVQDVGGAAGALAPFLMTVNQLGPAMRGLISPAKLLGGALGGLAGFLTTGLIDIARSSKVKGAASKIGMVIGKAIGPAIAASSALADGIGSALSKVGASAPIKKGADLLGKALGTTAGKAFGLAFVAAAVAVGIFELLSQNNEIRSQQEALLENNKKWLETATKEQIEAARLSAQQELDKLNEFNPLEFLVGSAARETSRTTLEQAIAEQDAALARLAENGATEGAKVGPATAEGIESGAPDVTEALSLINDRIRTAEGLGEAARELGQTIPGAIADGILDQQNDIDEGMAALRQQIEQERTPTAQAAHVIGNLISKEVSNGLRDGRPGVVARAREVRAAGEEELRTFIRNGGKIGKDAMDALAAGQKSKNGHIRKQSQRTLAIIDEEQQKLKGQSKKRGAEGTQGLADGVTSKKGAVRTATNGVAAVVRNRLPNRTDGERWGRGTIQGYADGLASKTAAAAAAALGVAQRVAAILRASSPPGPKSPLHFIDVWGERTMLAYAGGLEKGGEAAQSVLQRVLAAQHGFTVPVTASGVLGGSASIVGDVTIGSAAPINVATYGIPMKAETPAAVVRRIRRASRLGTVSVRPKPGSWERT